MNVYCVIQIRQQQQVQTGRVFRPQQQQSRVSMGNNTSNLTYENIKFIQNLQDQNYGQIQIYKNDEGKYIMMMRRTFMRDGINPQNKKNLSITGYKDGGFHQILAYINQQKQSQEFITPIVHSEAKVESLCITYQTIDTYCQYFNFTLADMIKNKKQMDREELWHCFYWFIRFIILLKEKDWILQEGLKLNRIFLTLKGTPTVSIHHLIKSDCNDQVMMIQRNMLEEVGLCMLQLVCMTSISEEDTNLELFLRKAQKIDIYMGQLLGRILRKSINSNKTKKISEGQVLDAIESLIKQQKIAISKEIKLNKFKYILPKAETKPELESTKTPSNISSSNVTTKSTQNYKSNKQPIAINSLHGRKNKDHLQLKGSSHKKDNKLNLDAQMYIPNGLPLQTPSSVTMSLGMNRTLTFKNALLIDEIQNRKKMSEKQKEKLTQRKEMIMNSGPKASVNKENVLGNSIREVRPSYQRKQSWTKKIINEHLKQSYRS